MKRSLLLLALIGCSDSDGPTPPPPPWGAPISGGTMAVTRDGARAIVADPDRDRVMIVDLQTGKTTANLALPPGSEPGRVIEDGAGRAHIALRGMSALLTVDVRTGKIASQRLACTEPRGLAWDPATDLVHVACTSGELVSFPAGDGDVVRSLVLDRDLRDVVVRGSQLVVTRFRTAEVITLDAEGAIVSRVTPPLVTRRPAGSSGGAHDGSGSGAGGQGDPTVANPAIAWRTIALPDGRVLMSHQRKSGRQLGQTPNGYNSGDGGGCEQSFIESAITIVDSSGTPRAVAPFVQGALPVDVAVDPSGTDMAFVSAGRKTVHVIALSSTDEDDDDDCGDTDQRAVRIYQDENFYSPTSVAYRPNGELVVFYPEVPELVVHAGPIRKIQLPGGTGFDAGRTLFHTQTNAKIACASCHPEARDDGQTWFFVGMGGRRTQSLAGGILTRAPYHWSADMPNLSVLMTDVFSQRMSGGEITELQRKSLGPWLDRIPAPQSTTSAAAAAVERGQQLFLSQGLGCTSCHVGPQYTNNALVNVGTLGYFKVPSLVGVGVRAPFMHDGCAATLRDRFVTCGGGDLHGKTSQLSQTQLDDLIAFLETL